MEKELREELLRLNDQLADVAVKDRARHHRVQKLRDEAELLRARAVVSAVEARDERGRPRYSNEYTTRAAATVALHENPRYREIESEREVLWQEMESVRAETDRLALRRKILMVEAGIMDPLDLDESP